MQSTRQLTQAARLALRSRERFRHSRRGVEPLIGGFRFAVHAKPPIDESDDHQDARDDRAPFHRLEDCEYHG